jgi:hydroxymethylpyrimidine pyrophosphatase-like HAD family hydrolase
LQTSTIRLIGIDVDGTLVGTGGFIHPSVWEAAKRACERGIHLALCSGRPAFGLALEYARRLEAGGWHIFQNGASIVNLATTRSSPPGIPSLAPAGGSLAGRSVAARSRSVPIPVPWVKTVIEQARQNHETLELYSDTTYVVESTSDWAREHADLLGVAFEPRPFESLTQPIVRAQWLLSRTLAKEFMATAHPGLEVAQSTSPLMPDTQFVGLTHEGVTKGSAMRSIAEEYGVALQDVMYVGDAGNDLSALRIVGHPIAMGNADPAVIEAAKHTVDHVDRGGLAQALEMAINLSER